MKFDIESMKEVNNHHNTYEIVYDDETGVEYIVARVGAAGCITPRLDKFGNPVNYYDSHLNSNENQLKSMNFPLSDNLEEITEWVNSNMIMPYIGPGEVSCEVRLLS